MKSPETHVPGKKRGGQNLGYYSYHVSMPGLYVY